MLGKIKIRLVLLLLCTLIICLLKICLSQQMPPPLPKITDTEEKQMEKLAKELWKKDYAEIISQNLSFSENDNNTNKPYILSSRAGIYKPDIVLDDLNISVRSIWPPQVNWQTNWPFLDKDFYQSFFSIAVDFDGLNSLAAKKYSGKVMPKIKKGCVVFMVVYDPNTNENIYTGWAKANTDTMDDLNRDNNNPEFDKTKICLAVDSAQWVDFFQGKKVLMQFFCSGQIPVSLLLKAKSSQGTIVRPPESIKFD